MSGQITSQSLLIQTLENLKTEKEAARQKEMEKTRPSYTQRDVLRHVRKLHSTVKKVDKLRKLQEQISSLLCLEGETLAHLNRKTTRMYEEVKKSSTVELTECAICLAAFTDGEKELSLGSCRHLFHTDCLEEWRNIKKTCPCCRGDMTNPSTVSAYDFLLVQTLCQFAKEEQVNH